MTVRKIGVGFSSEEGMMVISLATNQSSCEWGQRRTGLAKNGSESHFSDLGLSCREKGFRPLGLGFWMLERRVQGFWTKALSKWYIHLSKFGLDLFLF